MEFKSDIEIAQECEKKKITEIAKIAGIDEKYLEQYGNYKAKVDYSFLKENQDKPDGKLILVTVSYTHLDVYKRQLTLMTMRLLI